jgi:hypothetical protein
MRPLSRPLSGDSLHGFRYGCEKRSRTEAVEIWNRNVSRWKDWEKNGGQGRNRTADASLFRAALYQLSYLARIGLHTQASVGWKTLGC